MCSAFKHGGIGQGLSPAALKAADRHWSCGFNTRSLRRNPPRLSYTLSRFATPCHGSSDFIRLLRQMHDRAKINSRPPPSVFGLHGMVKISRTVVNGVPHVNFDGFAPASQWDEFSASPQSRSSGSEVAK